MRRPPSPGLAFCARVGVVVRTNAVPSLRRAFGPGPAARAAPRRPSARGGGRDLRAAGSGVRLSPPLRDLPAPQGDAVSATCARPTADASFYSSRGNPHEICAGQMPTTYAELSSHVSSDSQSNLGDLALYCIFVLIQDFAAAGVPDYDVGCCEAGGWARPVPEVPAHRDHRVFSHRRAHGVIRNVRRYLRWAHRAQCNCAGAAPEQPLLRAAASHPLLLCACRRETAARPVAGQLGRQRRRGWLVAASLCGPLRPALTA
eukprot:COSAG06_NODE_2466_length_6820_cov_19.323613_5_plen_260_part_00